MTIFSEAVKWKDGIFYNLRYHQERVDKTLADFGLPTVSLSAVEEKAPSGKEGALYKCRILYSDKIEKVEFEPYRLRRIRNAGTITCDDVNYSYKYADRSLLNRLLLKSGCDEIIIVKNGLATDGFASNLVFESREGLFTPKEYLLPGTKRRQLLDQKRIAERTIRADEIAAFDAVYFINALTDLEDNVKISTRSLVNCGRK